MIRLSILVVLLLTVGCAAPRNTAENGQAALYIHNEFFYSYATNGIVKHVTNEQRVADEFAPVGVQGAQIKGNSVASGNSVVPSKVKIGASK